jgi:hypothetical protein
LVFPSAEAFPDPHSSTFHFADRGSEAEDEKKPQKKFIRQSDRSSPS